MVKRYYCDFCDRAYPYSTEAFQKHRSGHHHQKLRRKHYDQFKSAREKLQDEEARERCRKFFSGQDCSFGDTCVFSHLTQTDLLTLQQQAWEEDQHERSLKRPTAVREGRELSVEAWLQGRDVPLAPEPRDSKTCDLSGWQATHTTLPSPLLALPHLPPSLAPLPPPQSWLNVEFAEWG